MLGGWSILLIAIVALVIFGPKKLPELGKSFGHTLKEFKQATKGLADDDDDDDHDGKHTKAEKKD